MNYSKKNFSIIILSIFLLTLIVLVLVPYSRSISQYRQREKESNIKYQALLQQKRAKREAAEKIYLTGKFDPALRKDFAPVPAQFSISGNKIFLRQETLDAFTKMRSAADKEEIDLKIASATRNFDYQKNLWNNKWTGATLVEGQNLAKSIPNGLEKFKKILEYSAVPGTSRHHWGTDIDINGATPEYFENEKGEEVYEWLVKNAATYGFCQTYNQKGAERPTGYNEEKWHWSYLPLARDFTREYKKLIADDDINGFDGDEFVEKQDLIKNYVLGINPDCI